MTLDDVRGITKSLVEDFGPEKAKEELQRRCDADPEFCMILAEHGADIVKSLIEGSQATHH